MSFDIPTPWGAEYLEKALAYAYERGLTLVGKSPSPTSEYISVAPAMSDALLIRNSLCGKPRHTDGSLPVRLP